MLLQLLDLRTFLTWFSLVFLRKLPRKDAIGFPGGHCNFCLADSEIGAKNTQPERFHGIDVFNT